LHALVNDMKFSFSSSKQKKEQQQQQQRYHDKDTSSSPFDVVILDHKIPKKDGLQAAKEILDINPEQRIIFASAYVKETLTESVKQLKKDSRANAKAFFNICISRHC
jgi:CheY-like chemotaxis protein